MADGEGVFTNIDAFVKYLKEHGETEGSVIAGSLGVSERNVEEWAKILENSRMAKIVYKLGRMYVAPAEELAASTSESRQMAEVKKTIISSDINSQVAYTTRLAERIEEFNKAVVASDNVINTNAATIRERLSRLSKLQNEAASSFNEIKSRKETIDKFSQELGGMIATLSSGAAVPGIMENRNASKAMIEDLRSKIHLYEESTSQLIRTYDDGVREQRNKLLEFVKSSRAEIDSLKDQLREEERNFQKYEGTYKNFSNESARIRQVVDRSKVDLLDKAAKAQAQISGIYQDAEKQEKELEGILAKAKEGLAGFEELTKKLGEIKKDVADAVKENNDIRMEVEALMQQLKAADSAGRQSNAEKQENIDRIDAGTDKVSKKLEKHEGRLGRLKKKMDDMEGGK